MATTQELEEQFWKELKSDTTVMLGLVNRDDGHARPMTAQLHGERSPLWFFTVKDTDLVSELSTSSGGERAFATFASKDHGLFASIHGTLKLDNDRAMVDKLWNRFVAAWYEGGKDDPKLALLRFDPEHAEIWRDASSVLSGIKLMLGIDPKQDYKDQTAQVSLRH
jgi:general stress protein 26